MSAWIKIAEAVAVKNGVADELFVRDRIGKINEDNLNSRDVTAKTFNNGQEAVKFGGQGIGGNAVARFGVEDGSEGDMSKEAAEEFAAIINSLKTLGLTEEVLLNDDLSLKGIAEAMGATFVREDVNSIADDVDLPFNVKQFSSGEWAIQFSGRGVGGNGVVRFAEEDQASAEAFSDLMNLLEAAGLQDELFGIA